MALASQWIFLPFWGLFSTCQGQPEAPPGSRERMAPWVFRTEESGDGPFSTNSHRTNLRIFRPGVGHCTRPVCFIFNKGVCVFKKPLDLLELELPELVLTPGYSPLGQKVVFLLFQIPFRLWFALVEEEDPPRDSVPSSLLQSGPQRPVGG